MMENPGSPFVNNVRLAGLFSLLGFTTAWYAFDRDTTGEWGVVVCSLLFFHLLIRWVRVQLQERALA
jgi:hypothetical protein